MPQHPVRDVQEKIENSVHKLLTPFEEFVESQASTGILLACATLIALIAANSPFSDAILSLRHVELGFSLNDRHFSMPLLEWVNHGLMTLFFFLLGLEIKREVLAGQLRDFHNIALVLCAAAGGMVFPGLIYFAFNPSGPALQGWAIPMATDTAFAVGLLTLVAKGQLRSLFLFLTALAIFDDLGAILIIALFYTGDLDMTALLYAALSFLGILTLNILGARKPVFYLAGGLALWYFTFQSGVHSTLAGVVMALTVPARQRTHSKRFVNTIKQLVRDFNARRKEKTILSDQKQHELIYEMEELVRETETPLQRWESTLENPIGLLVLPIFALLNASIYLLDDSLLRMAVSPVALGICFGLFIGKPLGITLFSWLAVRLGIGRLPEGTTFYDIFGIGLLAGIGFTMSIFIAVLGFRHDPMLIEEAKLAVLVASLLSGIAGSLWLWHRKEDFSTR